jgi:MSHA biogenesis protein MshN
MLKDLDQRQHGQPQQADDVAQAIQTTKQPKTWLIVAITIIITLFIIFSVYLYQQNQQLNASLASKKNAEKVFPQKKLKNNVMNHLNEKNNTVVVKKSLIAENENNRKITADVNPLPQVEITKDTALNNRSKNKIANVNVKTRVIGKNKNTKSDIDKSTTKENVAPKVNTVKSSISVSRRKVSAEHLAKQKIQQAEDAVNNNELAKAETLLEDVLVLTPNNKTARKQLAALWFGRKAYQSALNLLSQGIALAPQESEFRLMQARIYLTQGLSQKAYQVLKEFKQSDDVEYLLTLANVAQQLAQYPQAIAAYRQLATLQPTEGRWWLGLAVTYDSDKQYLLASNAYRAAIAQGKLSNASLKFAKKRLAELGE